MVETLGFLARSLAFSGLGDRRWASARAFGGWKILIPVRFTAADFPPIPNIPSVEPLGVRCGPSGRGLRWFRTSKQEFQSIKA